MSLVTTVAAASVPTSASPFVLPGASGFVVFMAGNDNDDGCVIL